jgi:Protein of unknown function (DUF2961)
MNLGASVAPKCYYGVNMNHFDTLRTEPLKWAKVEYTGVAPGAEYTLFQDTGPGVVESLWMAVDGGNYPVLDGRIRIYYGSHLNVDIDLGTLLVTHCEALGVNGNDRISVDLTDRGQLGFLFTYPIPYGVPGIHIAYYNVNAGQWATIYSMVAARHLEADYMKRLRCQGRRYLDQKVSRGAGDVTLLADITGWPGSLVYHSQVGGVGAQDMSWLERNIAVTVDGVRTIESSGTEDWFDSAWYFGWGRSNYRVSPYSFVGTDQPSDYPNAAGMATNLWSKLGGIPWTTSCKVEALTEPGCHTGDTLCWCILYYQKVLEIPRDEIVLGSGLINPGG